MSINIFIPWILICICATLSEQKLIATNFRTLPLRADKLTIAELPSYNLKNPYGPGTYAFGYEIDDAATKNIQFRDEEKLQNGTVRGSYGLVRPNGLVSITRYIADDTGYHSSTQTFSQNDKKPTLLTSTISPFLEMSSPSDVTYLDVPNPVTISPAVAQQILEQHKIDLLAPSSNDPITDTFSSSDDDSDVENLPDNKKEPQTSHPASSFQELIPSSHIPQIKPDLIFDKPVKTNNTNEKKIVSVSDMTLAKDEKLKEKPKPTIPSEPNSIIEALSPPKPHIPKPRRTTKSPKDSTTAINLSDESNKDSSTETSSASIPSFNIPQIPNIFESLLPHIPQLPVPVSMKTTTNEPEVSTTDDTNSLSDIAENESTSTTSTTKKPPGGLPQLPNIFENLLPHIPQLPLPSNLVTTTNIPSTSTESDLADENQPENPSTSGQESTTSPLNSAFPGFNELPPMFSFLNPANLPIFRPPSNSAPNKQENINDPSIGMDITFNETPATIEPIFAVIHKNATIVPLYDDDGNSIGIQLVNNFIPSNFQIIPFIVPNNYFQSSATRPQNFAYDEVSFEDGLPNIVNDKFHDPLVDINPLGLRRKPSRKRKFMKKIKVRRNSKQRRCSIH